MEIAEIDKLTAGVINAPFEIVKKGQFKHCDVIGEVEACCGYLIQIIIQFLLTSLSIFKLGK